MERAGSMLRAWLTSHIPCIWSETSEQAPLHQIHSPGMQGLLKLPLRSEENSQLNHPAAEREMPVYHNQPHLVPPMKLVLYDDIPNSPPIDSHPSIMSRCVTEGRALVSKASSLTGLGIKTGFRRKSRKRSISGPSDFRRVSLQEKAVGRFKPLELNFNLPGNRLSDLPEFDNFDLGSAGCLTEPPKALSTPNRVVDDQLFGPPSATFTVPRKPVGQPTQRSSVRSSYIEIHDRRKSNPHNRDSISGFCTTGKHIDDHLAHNRPDSQTSNSCQYTTIGDLALAKELYLTGESSSANAVNAHVPEAATVKSRDSTTPYPPTTNDLSIRSRLVAQWLSLKSPSAFSIGSKSPSHPTTQSRISSGLYARSSRRRSRTLSGSTITSLTNGSIFTNSKRTPSLSSTITATTYRPSNAFCGAIDKDCGFSIDNAISEQLPVHYEMPCVATREKHQQVSIRSSSYYHDRAIGTNDIGLAL